MHQDTLSINNTLIRGLNQALNVAIVSVDLVIVKLKIIVSLMKSAVTVLLNFALVTTKSNMIYVTQIYYLIRLIISFKTLNSRRNLDTELLKTILKLIQTQLPDKSLKVETCLDAEKLKELINSQARNVLKEFFNKLNGFIIVQYFHY